MRGMLSSTTIVSRDQYIERSADLQIQRIISEMARPGYVLVARQMGKTNLLLHTKDVMQSDKNIFVYADFSTMASYSEQECLNSLIDTAIESKFDLLSDAEEEIASLRKRESYNASKMFYRELRIILKYVDKLVFILDEIDALTRTEYSDRIFSLIRGHYYANTNYPELKRATYILSGVIEPKDIIKDPNISPFNIGEKIYMNDFTYDEFLHIIEHSEYLSSRSYDIINRLYYWTKGQPRMSWDLCSSAEEYKVKTVQDVDSIVRSMYLKSYDRAPIDAIREKVKLDSELREALIQLSIDRGDSITDDIKSKLYLAGIIDYQQASVCIKNPILEKSLPYDWLISLHDQDLNYLSVADKSIHLERDYKKAITHLTKFLESNPTNIEDIDKAHYLLGEAHFKSYRTDMSLVYLEKLMNRGSATKFYYDSILLKGNTLAVAGQYLEAEKCFRYFIQNPDIKDTELLFKASTGIASVLLAQETPERWDEAESVLQDFLTHCNAQALKPDYFTLIFYYLACIEEKRGNHKSAVANIDNALKAAQPNERPYLLYIKHENVDVSSKGDTATELYESLSLIKSRPESKDYENILGFNLVYASQILSMLMLKYPQFDVTKYLRYFLYESKENAVIYIHEILVQNNDNKASEFFELILRLLENDEWLFGLDHCSILAMRQIRDYDKCEVALTVISGITEDTYLPDYIQELFSTIISFYIKKNSYAEAGRILKSYRELETKITQKVRGFDLLIDYYECRILYKGGKLVEFPSKAAVLLNSMIEYSNTIGAASEERLPQADVTNIINNLQHWLSATQLNKRKLGIDAQFLGQIERNTRICVQYIATGEIKKGKYKALERDLTLGICILIEILG